MVHSVKRSSSSNYHEYVDPVKMKLVGFKMLRFMKTEASKLGIKAHCYHQKMGHLSSLSYEVVKRSLRDWDINERWS